MARRVWNMLCNGMGGIDWSGLEIAVEMLGIEDPEMLIRRLLTIKLYTPPKKD